MTDITELTAKLKAAAQDLNGETWRYLRLSVYGGGYIINGAGQTVVCTDSGDVPAVCARFIETANPANILALTEALEAAEQNSDGVAGLVESYETTISMLKNRIAELEARTLTVKLPKTFWYEHDDLSRDVAVLDRRLVKRSLREACEQAGIKLQIEGE